MIISLIIIIGVAASLSHNEVLVFLLTVLFGIQMLTMGFVMIKLRYRNDRSIDLVTKYVPILSASGFYRSIEQFVLLACSVILCLYIYFWFFVSLGALIVLPYLSLFYS